MPNLMARGSSSEELGRHAQTVVPAAGSPLLGRSETQRHRDTEQMLGPLLGPLLGMVCGLLSVVCCLLGPLLDSSRAMERGLTRTGIYVF